MYSRIELDGYISLACSLLNQLVLIKSIIPLSFDKESNSSYYLELYKHTTLYFQIYFTILSKMEFLPCYTNNLSPLFQLLDDYDVHRSSYPKAQQHHRRQQPVVPRSFTPRFDARELNDAFYLDGELPGADQNHIEIEFSDPNTLVIKGRVDRNYDNTDSDHQMEDQEAAETSSNRSYQATVEDEEDDKSTKPTPAPVEKTVTDKKQQPTYKYRVSERSTGDFHRVFTFPTRVDQDAVKATFRNGILSLVIPKEPAPTMKKVRIE